MTDRDTKKSKIKWLNRDVFGFGITSFFSDLSHEVTTTLLPVFLASLGAPPYAVGVIEGLADGASNLAKLIGGWLSDRLKKRKWLALVGYVLTGGTQGLFAFVTVWPQALFLRVVGWLGRGWRGPIRDALFHDAVPKEASGRAFGFERMMDTLGAVLAPLAVFLFLNQLGYRNLFLLAWIPGILAICSFLILVREKAPRTISEKPFTLFQGFQNFSPAYKRFLLAVTLFGLSDFSHTILIYWAGKLMMPLYGTAQAASLAILLYVIHNIVYAAASYPAGRLGDRFGKFPVLAAGYGLGCAMFALLAFAKGNFYLLVIVFILGGLCAAAEDTLERAIAGDLLKSEIKGTGYGALATLNGLGDLFSSLMIGALLSIASPLAAFGMCFLLGAGGTFLMSRIKSNE